MMLTDRNKTQFEGQSPDQWVHFLRLDQAGTITERCSSSIHSLAMLAKASLKAGDVLPVQENFSPWLGSRLSAVAAPAGWIVALEARADGLWGKVEWSPTGRHLKAQGAYASLIPILAQGKSGNAKLLLGATLANSPTLLPPRRRVSNQPALALRAAVRSGHGDDAHSFGVSCRQEGPTEREALLWPLRGGAAADPTS
ncbi:MAG: phage protease [Pseudomonadota bacterium]